jgi:hypothetical protein
MTVQVLVTSKVHSRGCNKADCQCDLYTGYFKAYVVQENVRGGNLCEGHKFTTVDSAKVEAQAQIGKRYGRVGPVEIEWLIDAEVG